MIAIALVGKRSKDAEAKKVDTGGSRTTKNDAFPLFTKHILPHTYPEPLYMSVCVPYMLATC